MLSLARCLFGLVLHLAKRLCELGQRPLRTGVALRQTPLRAWPEAFADWFGPWPNAFTRLVSGLCGLVLPVAKRLCELGQSQKPSRTGFALGQTPVRAWPEALSDWCSPWPNAFANMARGLCGLALHMAGRLCELGRWPSRTWPSVEAKCIEAHIDICGRAAGAYSPFYDDDEMLSGALEHGPGHHAWHHALAPRSPTARRQRPAITPRAAIKRSQSRKGRRLSGLVVA